MGLILRAVPLWAWALAAVLAWGGLQKASATRAAGKLATQQIQAERARGDALHGGLLEINRRLAAQQEAANAADEHLRRAVAAAAAADRAGAGLRDAARAAAARACGPAAAAVGASASPPADMLADVLGRLEEDGRAIAREADKRNTAGGECVGRYDALMPPR
jgi:hypothetical protein